MIEVTGKLMDLPNVTWIPNVNSVTRFVHVLHIVYEAARIECLVVNEFTSQ